MKKRLKKSHSYTKDRAVLSDTLAYETPLTFSNRYFYRFLKNNNVELIDSIDKGQLIRYKGKQDSALETVIRTLFFAGKAALTQEIRFDDEIAFHSAIAGLLLHVGSSSFKLSLKPVLILHILNKNDFIALISKVDNLKSEVLFLKSSLKRNHFHNVGNISILKVITGVIQKYCSLTIDMERHGIKCSVSHPLYATFKSYSIIAENSLKVSENRRVSFSYKISHKQADYRELSIPHPKSQIELVYFYEEFKELIIYYCSLSPYSIRKPDSVANYIFFDDKFHVTNSGDNHDAVEESGKEYESLKTFFTYRKYSNIHRFYEDYRYHRAEKKYNSLFKFDIAKCFDSIYTHSIAWAIYNKNVVKDKILSADKTFAGKFDSFMQNLNYGETNGIIIGPEFSRVFAEIILQSIDREVESSLRIEKGLVFKRDYEVYRYVDDYFIFYNDNDTKDEILSRFKVCLKNYKMSISDSKNMEYEKPLITELTIAKDKIITLFESELYFDIKDIENSVFANLDFRCNSKNLITKFKIIISESKVSYKDIMNFTLAVLNKRVDKAIEKFDYYYGRLIRHEFKNSEDRDIFTNDDIVRKVKHENRYTNFLIEVLDFTFFIYAVDPRVNFTIKLCRIISKLIAVYSERVKLFTGTFSDPNTNSGPIYTKPVPKFLQENIDRIFKKMSDEIRLVLEKNKVKKYAQIESLYLLIAVQQLGREFSLSSELLIKYFGLKRNQDQALDFEFMPNYFVITVLLFYIRDANKYKEIRQVIQSCILEKIKIVEVEKGRDAECTMLLFDVLSCPYLGNKFKREALTTFGILDFKEQEQLLNFKNRQKYWFTKWDKFNFLDEIEAKIAHEPY